MTHPYFDMPAIDLPTLDGAIRLHLQAHARRAGGLAERFARSAGDTSAVASLLLVDPDQDLFAGGSEAVFACRMFRHGFECALALVAVVSRSPFCPNDRAIAAVLQKTRADIAATVEDERAKWGLPGGVR